MSLIPSSNPVAILQQEHITSLQQELEQLRTNLLPAQEQGEARQRDHQRRIAEVVARSTALNATLTNLRAQIETEKALVASLITQESSLIQGNAQLNSAFAQVTQAYATATAERQTWAQKLERAIHHDFD